MPTPNPTQQKIIDIAAKYGYQVTSCYAAKFKKGWQDLSLLRVLS